MHVNYRYSILGWVWACNNDPAQGLHTLKSDPEGKPVPIGAQTINRFDRIPTCNKHRQSYMANTPLHTALAA